MCSGARGRDGGIKEGQKLRVLMAPMPGLQRLQPIRVIIANDASIEAVVALSDTGKYVSVDVSNAGTEVADNPKTTADENDTPGVTLYQSVYETALRNQIPRPIIEDLIRIYSYDVDFQRKVQPGDSFEVLYAGEDETPAADSRNDVLFAALTIGGESRSSTASSRPTTASSTTTTRAARARRNSWCANRSPKASCARRSASDGIRSSATPKCIPAWTGRRRPARRSMRPATASSKRPAGNRGYGKFVLLRHNNGYETAYGHMSAFARGIEEGKRVRQGQVIGFVGSTGLSTGSHVHYEIRVNGRFVDPMRIKLPRGRELEGPMLASLRAGARTARRHHGAQARARGGVR